MLKKNTSVPKIFDEQLQSLLAYIKEKNWTLLGIDLKVLEDHLQKQREEKQKDLELERKYLEFHQQFSENQSERYSDYMKTVEVLRAAHRDDPEILRALEQFKRPVTGKKAAAPKADPHQPPA